MGRPVHSKNRRSRLVGVVDWAGRPDDEGNVFRVDGEGSDDANGACTDRDEVRDLPDLKGEGRGEVRVEPFYLPPPDVRLPRSGA